MKFQSAQYADENFYFTDIRNNVNLIISTFIFVEKH